MRQGAMLRHILFASLISLAGGTLHGQSNAGEPVLATRIDSVVRSYVDQRRFSGVVLVAREGEVVFERAYGLASAELGVPVATATRFRIHSISKQVTAMAVMILAERGRLSTSDPAARFLPELPARWRDVTIEQLLQHTSGVPQGEGIWFEEFQKRDAPSECDNWRRVAARMANDSLLSPPGSKWQYNNFGYDLLSCIAERAAGVDFVTFVQREIFDRSGMTTAGYDARSAAGTNGYLSSRIVPGLAYGYNGAPDSLQLATPQMYASKGAGGVYASARDLLAYDRALAKGALVSPSAVRAMETRTVEVRPGVRYGFGWLVRQEAGSPRVVHHSGGNNGYMAEFVRLPESRATIIVLSNLGFAPVDAMRQALTRIVTSTASR